MKFDGPEVSTRPMKVPRHDRAAPGSEPVLAFGDYLRNILETDPPATKGERTRVRLKIAAVAMLERRGYHELRISDICDGARVSLGTFYVYFKDKKDIACAVLRDFTHTIWKHDDGRGRPGDAYTRIHRANRRYVTVFRANPGLMRCLLQLDNTVPEFADIWREANRGWGQRFIEGARSTAGTSQISDDTLALIGMALGGMVDHILHSLFVRRDETVLSAEKDLEVLTHLLSTLWYRALYGGDPPVSHLVLPRLPDSGS